MLWRSTLKIACGCLLSSFPSLHYATEPGAGQWDFSAEYLAMFFKREPVPIPIVTSGALSDTLPGALGEPGTHVLMGNESISTGRHSGGRFTLRYTPGNDSDLRFAASYFFTEPKSRIQTAQTSGLVGALNLAVPIFDTSGFTNVNAPVPGESVYVLPGPFTDGPGFEGQFQLQTRDQLQGAEFNTFIPVVAYPHLQPFVGFRWLGLDEKLSFRVNTSGVSGTPVTGQFFNTADNFSARNNFYGIQLGTAFSYHLNQLDSQLITLVAIGDIHNAVGISGSGVTSNGNYFFTVHGPAALNSGIFAQPSNIGHFQGNRFAFLPELKIDLGYQVMPHLRIFSDYQILYLSNVARPGSQMNREINTTRTGLADAARATGSSIAAIGAPSPVFQLHRSAYWAQGVSIGVSLKH